MPPPFPPAFSVIAFGPLMRYDRAPELNTIAPIVEPDMVLVRVREPCVFVDPKTQTEFVLLAGAVPFAQLPPVARFEFPPPPVHVQFVVWA